MKQFVLEEKDRNALVSYLQARPYAEVYQGINLLLGLKEVESKVVDEKE